MLASQFWNLSVYVQHVLRVVRFIPWNFSELETGFNTFDAYRYFLKIQAFSSIEPYSNIWQRPSPWDSESQQLRSVFSIHDDLTRSFPPTVRCEQTKTRARDRYLQREIASRPLWRDWYLCHRKRWTCSTRICHSRAGRDNCRVPRKQAAFRYRSPTTGWDSPVATSTTKSVRNYSCLLIKKRR